MKRTRIAVVGLMTALSMALSVISAQANSAGPTSKPETPFKVVAFYKPEVEAAHLSFIQEANRWFSKQASTHRFTFESTTNWDNLNSEFLSNCRVVVILNFRPEGPAQN